MQNIQDLKEKIFFESRNIIDILEKINNVDELLSKQDLVDELANRISFLRLLEKNIEYFIIDNSSQNSENQFIADRQSESHESGNEVTEEEAIFNNELNEIDENSENISGGESFHNEVTEEEAIFNNQLNEIVEGEFHEGFVNLVEQSTEAGIVENTENSEKDTEEEENVFMNQLNEIDENEPSDYQENVLSFVDEERILANAEPENDDDLHENMFVNDMTEEEVIFNNQLNEIDEFENEVSDYEGSNEDDFEEEEKIQDHFESEVKPAEYTETIPSIFDTEILEDEEILVEETEDQFINSHAAIEQGEMMTETSNVENLLNEIKNEGQLEEKQEEKTSEDIDRRKIVDIDRPLPETEKEKPASDESFENLDAYQQERKIKLANIKGLKVVQTLFDDDPLEREIPKEKEEPVVKEETGSILKTNIPTDYMEAEKAKPEFRLDLNDRIAFSKVLFGGSQSELNEVVSTLNSFKTLDEAKEYLSELYYEKNWKKVDEYAQRLWVLVENKFL